MGSLLYLDDSHAICSYSKGAPDKKVIKTLLQVNPSAPNLEKHIIPLLDAGLTSTAMYDYLQSYVDLPNMIWEASFFEGTLIEFATENPSAFGFDLDETCVLEAGLKPLDSIIYSLNVDNAKWGIARIAESVQFLAKLYLLSEGVKEFSALVPDISPDVLDMDDANNDDVMSIEVSLPIVFQHYLHSSKLYGAGILSVKEMGRPSFNPFFNVVFECKKSMLVKRRFAGWKELTGDGELAAKASFAISLVGTLMNYTASSFCSVDSFGVLRRGKTASLWSVLFECMQDNTIKPCPHCKAPVYVPKPSSKPFCKAGCQQRYKERARAMYDGGVSVDEVANAFPCINRKTIENWASSEGR